VSAQARCQECRDGRKRALRQRAIDFGLCEVNSCRGTVYEKYKCLHHFTENRERVAQYRAKRAGKRLAAKLAAELPLAVDVPEACK
jgi:hypothetical protein